jgi:putative phosphoesterase
MKIGVISDTHSYLDPKVLTLLAGVDHILHAGDVGMPRVLFDLERIAPVTAVGGNTDDPGLHYRLTELVELGGRKFLVHHIVKPRELNVPIEARLAREKPDVVVFGHTHKPFCETIDGRLYFNPGYAGKPRFNLERTVGILHCDEKGIRAEHLRLGPIADSQ